MIPNIIHFVFFCDSDFNFTFCYYLAIYSAYLINSPEKIYFYYDKIPKGEWWDKTIEIPNIILERVEIPLKIGEKEIIHIAHKADKVRMDKLFERGGIYMDIDTISYKSYEHLLDNKVVLGRQVPYVGLCNAIMMTEPKSEFFKIWLENYEQHFQPTGWNESSISLPYELSLKYPELLKVMNPETFFIPSYNETQKIFTGNENISSHLITLHLWGRISKKYMDKINGWEWASENKETLYGKIMLHLISLKD